MPTEPESVPAGTDLVSALSKQQAEMLTSYHTGTSTGLVESSL